MSKNMLRPCRVLHAAALSAPPPLWASKRPSVVHDPPAGEGLPHERTPKHGFWLKICETRWLIKNKQKVSNSLQSRVLHKIIATSMVIKRPFLWQWTYKSSSGKVFNCTCVTFNFRRRLYSLLHSLCNIKHSCVWLVFSLKIENT